MPALPNSSVLFVGAYSASNTGYQIPKWEVTGLRDSWTLLLYCYCNRMTAKMKNTYFLRAVFHFIVILSVCPVIRKAVKYHYIPLAACQCSWGSAPHMVDINIPYVSNDEDKAGRRGRFMTALAWCTHSCIRLAGGPLQGGWWWWCWGGVGRWVNKKIRRATVWAAFSPPLLSEMSGQTCTYVVISQSWQTCRGEDEHSYSNILFSGCKCKAHINATFQAMWKIGICNLLQEIVQRSTT